MISLIFPQVFESTSDVREAPTNNIFHVLILHWVLPDASRAPQPGVQCQNSSKIDAS